MSPNLSRRRLQSMGMLPQSIHAEEEDNTPRVCGDGVCSRECSHLGGGLMVEEIWFCQCTSITMLPPQHAPIPFLQLS